MSTIQFLFAENFSKYANKPALQCGERILTYRELDDRSAKIAAYLLAEYGNTQCMVSLLLEDRIDMIVAIIGILRARCIFIPIETNLPASRIGHMLSTTGSQIIITNATGTLPYPAIKTVEFDEIMTRQPESINWPVYNENDPAYVYFTSGSTGKPKPILGANKSLAHFISWEIKTLGLNDSVCVSQLVNPGFDASLRDIFVALCTGGTLCIPPSQDILLDPVKLTAWLSAQSVHVVHCVPSLFKLISHGTISKEEFPSLRYILMSGEKIQASDLKPWYASIGDRVQLVNLYGATETTLVKTCHFIRQTDVAADIIPAGKAIDDTEILLLDDEMHHVKQGEEGEIFIRTPYRSLGYLNEPVLNTQKFIQNPFSNDPADIIYKTGDRGRFTSEGNLLVLGRIDRQVKIRGKLVNPDEIELNLLAYEGIKEAVVTARILKTNDYELCAYLVCNKEVSLSSLRAHLADRLPNHMFPVSYTFLETLPLTPNGKRDINALPEPAAMQDDNFMAPQSETEKKLAEIWAGIFETDANNISRTANFFESGGHSLRVAILASHIEKVFRVEMPLLQIFEFPMLADIAGYIDQAEQQQENTIAKADVKTFYPLSSGQERIFFLQQYSPRSTAYNISTLFKVNGNLDTDRLQKAFEQVIARHESLRTSFEIVNGTPWQQVHETVPFCIQYAEQSGQQLDKMIKEFIQPFDMSIPPLMRVGVIKIKEDDFILIVDVHHSIADGTSLVILIKEMLHFYQDGQAEPVNIQYRDFSEWQHANSESERMQKQRQFWIKKFSNEITPLALPLDHTRPSKLNLDGQSVRFLVRKQSIDALKQYALQQETTLYVVLLTGYLVMLNRLSNQRNIVVGTIIAGRRHADLSHTIGMFANTLAIPFDIDPGMSLQSLLKHVKTQVLDAFENQDYNYEDLIRDVVKTRDASRSPLFDAMFNLQNMDLPEIALPGINFRRFDIEKGISKFDLTLRGIEENDQFEFTYEYNTHLFNRNTIDRFTYYIHHILDEMINAPQSSVGKMDLRTPEEKNAFSKEIAEPVRLFSEKRIHELFEEQADRIPLQTALKYANSIYTYKEVEQRANQVAHALKEQGIREGEVIALLLPRCPDTIIAMLGIVKAGAAFLPIEPGYPDARKQHMITDSGARILLTDKTIAGDQAAFFKTIHIPVYKMDDKNWWLGQSAERIQTKSGKDSAVYVIYTSGTTGLPKGVVINHSSMVNYICWSLETYVQGRPAVFPFFTSYSFDLTITSLFVPLVSGNTIIVYPKDTEDGLLLEKIFQEDEVTIIKLTPAHLKIAINLPVIPKKLEAMIVGGEALNYQAALAIHKRSAGKIAIYNEYGPTETTVGCIVHRFNPAEEFDSVPIGVPITNTYAYLLNESMQPVPDGVPGELYLGGLQVAQGYLGDVKKTAEKFLSDPFTGSGKMYRSGDLARRLSNGLLMYMGRIDDQVKIAGHRIELSEIENQLLTFPGIHSAAAVVNENKEGDKYIIACITAGESIAVDKLKQYVNNILPAYMQPHQYLQVEEIPLTTNGKVNKDAIIAIARNKIEIAAAPVTEEETSDMAEQLRMIWSEVLAVSKNEITANADFFRLGGHSLTAISLLSRIMKKWNVSISLSDIFDAAVFEKQLALINSNTVEQKKPEQTLAPLTPRAVLPHYPLSSAQRRLFVLHQLSPQSVVYNTPLIYIAEGTVDVEKMERVFRQLIHRYDSFRTVFTLQNGVPVQEVRNTFDFNVSTWPQADIPSVINQFVKPFSLDEAPLLRVGLMKIDETRSLFMIDTHHIISDEVSVGILLRDFVALYNEKTPAAPALQFKDVVQWQQDEGYQQLVARQKEFWMKQLSGTLPKVSLPADYPRPSVKSFDGSTITFTLNKEYTDKLKAFADQQKVTLYMVLLSVYNILISKLSDQEDIITGTITTGRKQAELQDVHGVFVNTVVLRTYPKAQSFYKDFLQEIKQTTLACFENQDYQYEDLVEAIGVERDTSSNPLFEVMFNMHFLAQEKLELPGFNLQPYPHHTPTTKFDLNLQVTEINGELRFNFSYATSIFKRTTVARFATCYQALANSIVENPGQLIADLSLLPAAEINKIVHSFNDTHLEYADQKLIHQLFEEQVLKNPSGIALLTSESVMTYKELNQQANQLAGALQKEGIGPGKFVSVTLERAPEMIVAVLGILKAGAAYVPAEPYLPCGRISTILQSLQISVIITDLQNLNKTAECTRGLDFVKTVICMEDLLGLNGYISSEYHWKLVTPEAISKESVRNPKASITSESLAYVIFTSGSTGTPKGVSVKHKPVINLIEWVNREFNVGPDDKLLFTTSLAFDLSVYDIFGTLAAGGTVRIALKNELQEPASLVDIMVNDGITFWDSAPASLLQLVPYMKRSADKNTALRLVFLSGDWVPLTLPDAVRQAFTNAKVIALGGATEATVWSNYFPVEEIDVTWRSIPYGKPIQNAAYYILDKNRKVCPIGVKGDLYIGGECLANGYINDKELSAKKFVPDPFRPGGTMYYTGDKARWFEDGNIEFLGREDSQVKIRGYRIELGEIEHQMLKHQGVHTVKVIVRTASGGNNYLSAYYVGEAGISEKALRSQLATCLPEYMIPAYFVQLEQMPVTSNGKLDLKALPDPAVSTDASYVAPMNEIEKVISEIWAQILKLPVSAISREADFFKLGGHSLTATFMLSHIHQRLDVKIPLIELFRRPVLLELAIYIHQSYKETFRAITPAQACEYYPVSSAQKRMFSLQYLMPELSAYNIPVAFELEGKVDARKIEDVFRALIDRHEVLRTTFALIDNEPVQTVHPIVPFTLERYSSNKQRADEMIRTFIRPFFLEEAPLVRAALIEMGEQKHLLVLDMHHIISDGFTIDILLRDFMDLYNGRTFDKQPLQYKDYTSWYQHPANKAMLQDQADYWLRQFGNGVPELRLPLDFPRNGYMDFEGDLVRFTINEKTDDRLHQLAEKEGATLYMTLLAAFNVLLAKLSGGEDIVTGSPVTGRRHSELQQIAGLFINVVAIRNQPSTKKSFKDFLGEVKKNSIAAFENQDYPFDELVEKIVKKRDWSRTPLFDTYFYLNNIGIADLKISGLTIKPYHINKTRTQYDLMLGMAKTEEGLGGVFTFATSRFRKETIQTIASEFSQLLDAIVENPDCTIGELHPAEKAESSYR
ncbi:amino acid adenylation domain-containing protein [Niastella sp. OAS944]|uniref:amino acid adenylation domain-containing protein n=1 Tax=Niastella sp. OAS944 TaxID=2664089 RepID=UPI00348202E8|nr:amino acid adenylation domain-containing protein [Chitinophagaceae bacterium OAS944]